MGWSRDWLRSRDLVLHESYSTDSRRLNDIGAESPTGTHGRVVAGIPSHDRRRVLRNLLSRVCLSNSMLLHFYIIKTAMFLADDRALPRTTLLRMDTR